MLKRIHHASDFLNPLGCRFWHFFNDFNMFLFNDLQVCFYGWENDLCFFMVLNTIILWLGKWFMFFMVLNVIFDFDRFW